MRARLVVGAALLAGLACAGPAASSTADRGRASCAPEGREVLVRSRTVAVYRGAVNTRACSSYRTRSVVLDPEVGSLVGPFVARGDWAAWVARYLDEGERHQAVRVLNGRTLFGTGGMYASSSREQAGRVIRIRLRSTGGVAWSVRRPSGIVEIWSRAASLKGEATRRAADRQIDPESLRFRGARLTWSELAGPSVRSNLTQSTSGGRFVMVVASSCRPSMPGAVTATSLAVVFRRDGRLRVCAIGRGGSFELGPGGITSTPVGARGRWVAYVYRSLNSSDARIRLISRVDVVGRTEYGGPRTSSAPGGGGKMIKVAVTSKGVIAWSVRLRNSVVEIWRYTGRGKAVRLAADGNIDPESLRFRGSRVAWTEES